MTTMNRSLLSEDILGQSSVMVEGVAAKRDQVLEDIERGLAEAEIPGGCAWAREQIRLGRGEPRELIVVRLERLPGFHQYLGVRPYGGHLELSQIVSFEPGFLKRLVSLASKGGKQEHREVGAEFELRAWVSVVQHILVRVGRRAVGIVDDGIRAEAFKDVLDRW